MTKDQEAAKALEDYLAQCGVLRMEPDQRKLKTLVSAIRPALKRLVEPSGWMPIEGAETAKPYMLWSPSTHTYPIQGRHWEQDDTWTEEGSHDTIYPTLFAELPLPPTEGEE